MLPSTLSWPLVAILTAILGGASFLGVDRVFSGAVTAGIYTGILGAVTVGHFATNTNSAG